MVCFSLNYPFFSLNFLISSQKIIGANATEKAVLEKVREMKVQVDNLMYYLFFINLFI